MTKKEKEEVLKIPKELPVLPVRDIVVFPYMIIPLFVARTLSINAIDEALGKDRMIFLATQKDQTVEEPTPEQLYGVGTVALIMRMLKMPDGRIKILVQGVARARTEKVLQEEPFLKVQVRRMREHEPAKGDLEAEALVRSVKEQMQKVATMGKVVLPDIMLVAENLDDPGRLSDLLGSNLGLRVHDAQAILEVGDPVARLRRVNELLAKEISLLEMQEKISSRAKGEIDKSQREYYLREQLKAIQKELGETDERSGEMAELRQKIDDAGMPEAVQTQAVKQLDRLEPHAPGRRRGLDAAHLPRLARRAALEPLDDRQPRHPGRGAGARRGPLRPREGQDAHPRVPRGAQAARADEGADPLLRRPPRRRQDLARPLDRPRAGPQVRRASASAACATRPRSAATGAPTSARCRAGSSRGSTRPARTTRSSCSTRSTSSAPTSAATPRRRCSRCSTRSRTTPSPTTTSGCPSTSPRCCSSPPPT